MTRHLDFREKGGYQAVPVTFHPKDENIDPFPLQIYIGSQDNPFFLGPAPLEQIAWQIYQAEGPSGKNIDYLFNLVKSLKDLLPDIQDRHLVELEQAVKQLCNTHG